MVSLESYMQIVCVRWQPLWAGHRFASLHTYVQQFRFHYRLRYIDTA